MCIRDSSTAMHIIQPKQLPDILRNHPAAGLCETQSTVCHQIVHNTRQEVASDNKVGLNLNGGLGCNICLLYTSNNRIDKIESSVVEKIDKQIQEVTENFECKITECNVVSEYKFNCVVDKIETYETSTNVKINEIESNCKTEIQAIQNTVNTIDKNNKQFE